MNLFKKIQALLPNTASPESNQLEAAPAKETASSGNHSQQASESTPALSSGEGKKKVKVLAIVCLVAIGGVGLYLSQSLAPMYSGSAGPVIPIPHLDTVTKKQVKGLIEQYEKEIRKNGSALGKSQLEQTINPTLDNIYQKTKVTQTTAREAKKDSSAAKPLSADEQQALARSRGAAPQGTPSHHQPVRRRHQTQSRRKSKKEPSESSFMANAISYSSEGTAKDDSAVPDVTQMIPGVINGNQRVRDNQRVGFRLLSDCVINGQQIPKNALVTAVASLAGTRVTFEVASLRYGGKTLPLRQLKCYDQEDMLEGLACTSDNAVKRGLKSSGRNTINDISTTALSLMPYNTGGRIARSGGRGITDALTRGTATQAQTEIVLQDGYRVFFIPTHY